MWKGNPTIHDPMLSIFNREGFDNGGTYVPTPLRLGVGISNELPQSDESRAFYDRFAVRTVVQNIADNRNFLALLEREEVPYEPATLLTVADIDEAVAEAQQVKLPSDVAESIAKLRQRLTADGHVIGDRRWRQSTFLLRAAAWLDGRTSVIEDDLEWMRFMLWDTPEQIDTVTKAVLACTSEQTQAVLAAIDYCRQASLDMRRAEALLDDSDSSPEMEKQRSEFTQQAATIISKTRKMTSRLEKIREQLASEGRSTARCEDAVARVGALRDDAVERGIG